MDILKSAIAEYEDTLLNKRKAVSNYYFSYEKTGNMRLALQIMQYAFDTYLKWSPQELRDSLTLEIMERLKLKPFLRYIQFPPELNPRKDLFYIAWQLYPNTVHYSVKDLILRVYQNLLDKKIQKYPKEFFTGTDGLLRAQVCLQYMISQHLTFRSVREMYAYFASHDCEKVLRKYRLFTVCCDLFESPLEYLHTALPKEQQQIFWYRFFQFSKVRSEQTSCHGEAECV